MLRTTIAVLTFVGLVGLTSVGEAFTVFDSSSDDGTNTGARALAAGGNTTLFLYIEHTGAASADPNDICAGDANSMDELCGFDVRVKALGDITLGAFAKDPDIDFVFSSDPNQMRGNGGDPIGGFFGTKRLGALPVSAGNGGGTVEIDGTVSLFVTSQLATTTVPDATLLQADSDLCGGLGGDADEDGICDDGGGNATNNDQPCACTAPNVPEGCAAGCDDNCPWIANPDQLDRGSLLTTVQDGIGDKCQCGDVNGDGKVTAGDGTIVKRFTIALPPGLAEPGNCDVNGTADDGCTGGDGTIIKRATIGLAPGLKQLCTNAQPPGVFPQTDPPPTP